MEGEDNLRTDGEILFKEEGNPIEADIIDIPSKRLIGMLSPHVHPTVHRDSRVFASLFHLASSSQKSFFPKKVHKKNPYTPPRRVGISHRSLFGGPSSRLLQYSQDLGQ